MRTTIQLINELQREAEGAIGCFLVVGFENTTLFIEADETAAIEKLDGMVGMGGHPVGLIRMWNCGLHEMGIEVRTLEECKDDPEIESYLEKLAEEFIQDADASGRTPTN